MVPLFFAGRAGFIAFAQIKDERQKQIGKALDPFEPVEIVAIRNRTRQLALDETFLQEKEWLKDFSIKIKNKSEKRISFLALQLEFPETTSTGDLMAFQMYYGAHPMRKPADYENEVPVSPGETLEMAVDVKRFDRLKKFIETRSSLDSLSRAVIRILAIHYDDGTTWSSGQPPKKKIQ